MLELRKIRQLRGYTQRKLAEEAHISRCTVYNIEQGITTASQESAQAISKVLGVINWWGFCTPEAEKIQWRGEPPI